MLTASIKFMQHKKSKKSARQRVEQIFVEIYMLLLGYDRRAEQSLLSSRSAG
jgi:hypothetical protein